MEFTQDEIKYYLAFVVPIFLILLIVGIFWYNNSKTNPKSIFYSGNIGDGVDDPELITLEELNSLEYRNKIITAALLTNDYQKCKDLPLLSGEGSEDHCYQQLSMHIKEEWPCAFMNWQTGPYSRDECLLDLSIELEKPELCDEMTQVAGEYSRDQCFLKYAVMDENEIYCENMFAVSGDISRDECFTYLAEIWSDETLCENVESETGFGSKEDCYARVAITDIDVTLCENIKTENLKTNCLANVKEKMVEWGITEE